MGSKLLTQILLCVSAAIFAACAVLQFLIGAVALGLLFSVIAATGLTAFVLIRLGRIRL